MCSTLTERPSESNIAGRAIGYASSTRVALRPLCWQGALTRPQQPISCKQSVRPVHQPKVDSRRVAMFRSKFPASAIVLVIGVACSARQSPPPSRVGPSAPPDHVQDEASNTPTKNGVADRDRGQAEGARVSADSVGGDPVAVAVASLGSRLAAELSVRDSNLAFSPLGLHLVLAELAIGAGEGSRQPLSQLLGISVDEKLSERFQGLIKAYDSRESQGRCVCEPREDVVGGNPEAQEHLARVGPP
jgi:Serpin (serine protease inhibitor)